MVEGKRRLLEGCIISHEAWFKYGSHLDILKIDNDVKKMIGR